MGEPITRLNPRVTSSINKDFLEYCLTILVWAASFLKPLEHEKRGRVPYDYRMLLVLCILRILLRKTYEDYEREMRRDPRICRFFWLEILPGKSTINDFMKKLDMKTIRKFNFFLIKPYIKRKLNIMMDASGIRIIGRSIWFCIRIKKDISKRECDKIHVAACTDLHLILNWFITNSRKHDSPYFIRLLKPFKKLGIVLADLGYLARKHFQFVADRKGALFIPFKSNSTGKPKGYETWKFAFNLWKKVNSVYMNIYHQRSKIEMVFSALKKRYGDKLYCRSKKMRRKEMALRFVAYNLRIVAYILHSEKKKLPLYVRA